MNFSDASEVRRQDPSGMLQHILRLPDMCGEAWALPADRALGPVRPSNIVALGMGGSGIGGELLRTVLFDESAPPVVPVRDYRAPGFVGAGSLVFITSYSGTTEETLAAYDEATSRGASCIVITSGGELQRRAQARAHPVVVVPKGIPQRAALAYLFVPMLAVLSRAGVVRSFEKDIQEASQVLKGMIGRLGGDTPAGPVRRLAETVRGRIPVIYSSSPVLAPAAERWKDQLNENAKTFAVWNTFPELNHNETVGWGMDPDLARQIHVIILRTRGEPARLAQRVDITKRLAFTRAAGLDEIYSEGEGKLARLLSVILFGDLVSWHLALLRGVDPTPVPVIEELKKRLAEMEAV